MSDIKITKRTLLQAALAAGTSMLGLSARAQESPGVSASEIKLGTWIPLTGPYASYGIPFRAGIDAAFGAANAAGGIKGRKAVMIFEDNAFNPQRTVAAARKLIERDQVLAIGLPFGIVTAAAFDYVLGEAKVPMINSYGSQIDWFQPPRPGFFGAMVYYESQYHSIGRWLAKDGHKSVVVLHQALASAQKAVAHVEKGVKTVSEDIKVEMMGSKVGTTDYVPAALEIVKKNPTCVLLFIAQDEAVAAAKELRQQGYKGEFYTFSPAVSNSTLELAGKALEGAKGISLTRPLTANTPGMKNYLQAMGKYAPTEPLDYVSLTAYALSVVTLEALRRIEGPITREALVKSMYTIRNFDTGILPPVSYAPDRHMGMTSVQRVVAKSGQWIAVGEPVEAEQKW